MPILFEKEAPKSKKNIKDKNQDGKTQIWGKSPWLQSVVVEIENHEDSVNLINKIKNVDVIKSRPSSLIGRLIQ